MACHTAARLVATIDPGGIVDNKPKPDHTPWLGCEAYVFRRHMLPQAKWNGEKLMADVCAPHEEIKCEDALDWIYGLLTAMDAKASALMRLNGVMLAAAAFLLSVHIAPGGRAVLQIAKVDEIAIVLTAVLSSISIFLCLYVVNVSWYFLGKVKETGGKLDYTEEFGALQRTAKRRQMFYRLGWKLSLFATGSFVLEFIRQTLFVFFGWGLI
jgi:hypothetical protein